MDENQQSEGVNPFKLFPQGGDLSVHYPTLIEDFLASGIAKKKLKESYESAVAKMVEQFVNEDKDNNLIVQADELGKQYQSACDRNRIATFLLRSFEAECERRGIKLEGGPQT